MGKAINILDYIPFGKENAVTRAELVRLTGLPDRAVRDAIENKRKEGAFILSSSSAKGYWQSDISDERRAFVREMKARRQSLDSCINALERG